MALRNDIDTGSAVTNPEIGTSEAARLCFISPVVGDGIANLGSVLVEARGLKGRCLEIVSSTNQRMSVSESKAVPLITKHVDHCCGRQNVTCRTGELTTPFEHDVPQNDGYASLVGFRSRY